MESGADRAEALRDRTWIGDCFVSKLTRAEVLAQVDEWVRNRDLHHYITAINVGKLVMMQRDEKLARYVRGSSINIADGFPIYLAPRLLGNPVPERITGVELMEDFMALADRNGYRVYFLGSRPEVLDEVVARCRGEYPNLVVAGRQDGYFSREEEGAVVGAIGAARPDFLFVALGVPQKEYFVHDHLTELNTVVSMPVGGAFDVYAGVKKRAPVWVQRFGVEWLWRAFYDTSRAGLIFRSMVSFIMLFCREFYRQRIVGVHRK